MDEVPVHRQADMRRPRPYNTAGAAVAVLVCFCLWVARTTVPVLGPAQDGGARTPAKLARLPDGGQTNATRIAPTGMAAPRQDLPAGRPTASGAQTAAPARPELTIDSTDAHELLATIRFPAPVLEPVVHDGRRAVRVTMVGCASLKVADQPALPVHRWDVLLPVGADTAVELLAVDDYAISSDPPAPSAGFRSRSAPPREGRFGAAYRGAAPYPETIARLSSPYQIRGLRGAGVILHPVRYLPASGTMQIVRSIQLRLRHAPAAADMALHYPAMPRSRAFRALAAVRFENYAESVADVAAADGTRGEGSFSGADSLLFVVPDAWDGLFDEFLAWKRQRGFAVAVARYPADTGSGTASLASYIQGAYDATRISHVLLVGDEDAIPHGTGSQKSTPSDTVYTLVAGSDSYHDILLSRVCVPTSAMAQTTIAKILAYERNPNAADGWRASGLMAASDDVATRTGSPYYGTRDDVHLDRLRGLFLDSGIFTSFDQVYEYDYKADEAGMTQAVSSGWNAGRSLVLYLGHGSATAWSSVPFSTTHAAALANGTALPFVVNTACHNSAFHLGDPCLSEAMLWGNAGAGGAIAVVGSTNAMDWDPPIAMLEAFTGYYCGQSQFDVANGTVTGQPPLREAGQLTFASIQRAMDYCTSVGGDGVAAMDLIMQQTHLFGDATMGVRTRTPRTLTVVHGTLVHPEAGLPVTVTSSGAAVENAIVTLTDASGNLSAATTDAAGAATVGGTPFLPGTTVTLTVYERDSLPYQHAGLQVGDGTVAILSSATPPVGFLHEAYAHTFRAVSGQEPYAWSVADGSLPEGMDLDPATGAFAGTPSSVGTFAFTIRVTDSTAVPEHDDLPVTWQVGEPVRIAAQDLPDATVGTAYGAEVEASGTFAPLVFSLAGGTLPDGLALAADGTVAGVPERQGSHALTVRATDSAGRTAMAEVSIQVQASAQVTITTRSLVGCALGEDYSAQLTATGGAGGGYVWQVIEGSLPDGLALSATGTISGTASAPGTATFTVQVTDDAEPPRTATASLSIFVGQPVGLADAVLPAATLGVAYGTQIEAQGNYLPITFALADSSGYERLTTASTFAESGTLQTEWHGDETHHELELGFAFPYFDQTYTTCRVGDNGYLAFGPDAPAEGEDGDCWKAAASRLDQFRMIAPFWSDIVILQEHAQSGIWLERATGSVTVRWRGYEYHYIAGGGDPSTDPDPAVVNVAVTLHASGRITFQYGTIRTNNRVVVGLGDAGEHTRIVELERDRGTYLSGWSGREDFAYTHAGIPPPGLSLSSTGLLVGIPTQIGSFEFRAKAFDAAGNAAQASFSLLVRDNLADTNSDGDVDNGEILDVVARWQAGEVTEQDVEAAIALWRQGPPAARATTREESSPAARTRLLVTFGDRATLDRLIDRGLIVTAVWEGEARIDATPEERRWLAAIGLPFREAPAPTTRETPDTYDGIVAQMQAMAAAHPTLCRIEQIGVSTNGRALLAMMISDNVHVPEDEPEVRIIGGIHGDERLSVTIPVRFAQWLLDSHGGESEEDQRATALVDSTEIWILPIMNPDGYEANTRENANGSDLNRSFPDGILATVSTVYEEGAPDTAGRQAETAAIMGWSAARRFVVGATMHTGAELVCYPYGNHLSGTSTYSAAPDDSLFVALSHAYADPHPVIDTVRNSCKWYRVVGELPDWVYRYTGSLEVTVELDLADSPPEDAAWEDNREPLLCFAEYAGRGVRGIVRDATTGQPLAAAIQVAGNARQVYTDPGVGDYHRVLLPGTYDLTFTAPDHASQTVFGVVVADGQATRLDVDLVATAGRHQATRAFPDLLYEPEATNGILLSVDLDDDALPGAFIVSETLPAGWQYVPGSSVDAGTGDSLAPPRLAGATVSWLFWRADVRDRQFSYAALAPAIRSDTAVFGGTIATRDEAAATTGQTAWLARTDTRLVLGLEAGWNLVSLPFEPSDSTVEAIFALAGEIAVWAWDNATAAYRLPDRIEAKEGYWVYAPAAAKLIVQGEAPADDGRGFLPGWNLFGPLADCALPNEAFLTGSAFGWKGHTYHVATTLLRTRGYWIRANAAGRASLR